MISSTVEFVDQFPSMPRSKDELTLNLKSILYFNIFQFAFYNIRSTNYTKELHNGSHTIWAKATERDSCGDGRWRISRLYIGKKTGTEWAPCSALGHIRTSMGT